MRLASTLFDWLGGCVETLITKAAARMSPVAASRRNPSVSTWITSAAGGKHSPVQPLTSARPPSRRIVPPKGWNSPWSRSIRAAEREHFLHEDLAFGLWRHDANLSSLSFA